VHDWLHKPPICTGIPLKQIGFSYACEYGGPLLLKNANFVKRCEIFLFYVKEITLLKGSKKRRGII